MNKGTWKKFIDLEDLITIRDFYHLGECQADIVRIHKFDILCLFPENPKKYTFAVNLDTLGEPNVRDGLPFEIKIKWLSRKDA